jgi:hypothetical protein
MSAQPVDQPPRQRPPKTPAGIRDALLPADKTRFETDFQACMRRATETYDLAPVQDCLNRWWGAAVMTADDPDGYREAMETADRILAGEYVPTVPWEETAARLGLDP